MLELQTTNATIIELGNEAEVVQPHPRTILRLAKLTTLNDSEMSLALNPNLLLPQLR